MMRAGPAVVLAEAIAAVAALSRPALRRLARALRAMDTVARDVGVVAAGVAYSRRTSLR